jgi:hypothetical protein
MAMESRIQVIRQMFQPSAKAKMKKRTKKMKKAKKTRKMKKARKTRKMKKATAKVKKRKKFHGAETYLTGAQKLRMN